MLRKRHMAVLISTLALAGGAGFSQTTRPAARPSTQPATKPATRPATPPATRPARQVDPLRVAILELQREAQAALQRREPFPRQTSDYFAEGNSIDPQALLKVLSGRIHQNPRVDAYVKYQLLSAVKRFEGELSMPAIKAYVLGAPPMITLPGLTPQEQQKWNQKATSAKKEDVSKINKEWNDSLAPYLEANRIIETYRDEMKSKIEPTPETKGKFYHACLEDLSQRAAAGFEMDKALTAQIKTIVTWAQMAPRAQLKDLQAGVKEYTLRKAPEMLEELVVSERTDRIYWRTHDAKLSESKLEKLIEELQKAADNAID